MKFKHLVRLNYRNSSGLEIIQFSTKKIPKTVQEKIKKAGERGSISGKKLVKALN